MSVIPCAQDERLQAQIEAFAEVLMISRGQRVDGVVIWDMVCGSVGRRCPKLARAEGADRRAEIGPYRIPPPCIFVFPPNLPTPDRPVAAAQGIDDIELLAAFHRGFGGGLDELDAVSFEVAMRGDEIERTTTVARGGVTVKASGPTVICRV